MSLCDLCKNIPWEDLPTVPKDVSCGLSGHPYIQACYHWPQDVRGYAHHQSRDALHQAASSCNLCSLIHASVENVQRELEDLEPKWKAGKVRQYDWPTWEMWLVKRREGGDGCWVMSFVGEDSNYEAWIVAALGICVHDGEALPFGCYQMRTVDCDRRSFGFCSCRQASRRK